MFKKISIASDRRALALFAFAFALFMLTMQFAAAQSCHWDGTAPFCSGACGSNQTELTRLDGIPDFWVPPFVNVNPPFGASCLTGTKALCCETPGRSCHWDGTAPFCNGACHSGETASQPPAGSSSGAGCVFGSKAYCCQSNTGTSRQPLTGARNCSFGADTCVQGFVWREAVPSDHVCVAPEVRQQTASDNSQAAARRNPNGGAYGPDTCRPGFVWRDAFAGDHVCVATQTRSQVAQDNHWATVRNACP